MPALPSGTITFLFTDIESSTKLWEEHPEAMRLALARHDALMRAAIEQHDGHIFKTMGDAFCAAFHTAPDALNAALDSQLALHLELWPEFVKIKVRMALHTGAAEVRDNDYFGPPLNRVARLLGTGHGGQVLLSLATEELTRDTLPPSTRLKAMGEHQLRDLARPEQMFQLLHPALPVEFPLLKSLDNPELPNNLPRQLTSFIGRESEIRNVKSLLVKTSLLTLTGSGGCGKTRLALQVAADVLEQYPDGVWLIELAPIADPGLVPQTVASVLGLTEQAGKPYTQILIEYLKSRRLLLLLDNCEHLLTACIQLADALLHAGAHVKILASSREGLGIAGELTYRVSSLSLPAAKQKLTLQSMNQYEAMQLFVERALFYLPGFTVTNGNVPALASICQRLDGIPLAIELAAARVRSLSVEEINVKLDNRFRLLTGGSKTALPRQQTLRALIDWSFHLLSSQEKTLLTRLSVFAGGWTLSATEQVGTGATSTGESIEDWEALDLLTGLVDKSLVIADTQGDTTRYRLLETVRQYARDRLVETEQAGNVRMRHRDYFLTLAEEIKPKLTGADQAYWLTALEAEHDNLRQALTFCEEESEGGEAGLRLANALQQFWAVRGHLNEGRERLATLLTHPGGQEVTMDRASVLNGAGILSAMLGDYARAQAFLEESLRLHSKLGSRKGIAVSLSNLGKMALVQGDRVQAHTLYEESLAIWRELGDKDGIAVALNNLGDAAYRQGNYTQARILHQESLAIVRELGDVSGIAFSLHNMGKMVQAQGDYPQARVLIEESLTIWRELGDKSGMATALNSLGMVVFRQGDYTTACSLNEEALSLNRELGDPAGEAHTLHGLGLIASEQSDYALARSLFEASLTIRQKREDRLCIAESLEAFASLLIKVRSPERGVRLLAAAEAFRESIGESQLPNEHKKSDQEIAQIRSTLGDSDFTFAWEEGRTISWEQAVAYALEKGSTENAGSQNE